jgi:flagellar biosynthesis protein FlhF
MTRIKSYFVKTMEEAMAMARAELGDDALLLHSRKGTGQEYEVAFGTPEGAGEDPVSQPPAAKLEEVRSQLEEIRRLLLAAPKPRPLPELTRIGENLAAAGWDPALAEDIVDRLEAGLAIEGQPRRMPLRREAGKFGWENFEKLLRSELAARIPIDSSLGTREGDAAVLLVGPGGAGKTTTLMKLAAFQTGGQRSVRMLTLDAELASRMRLQFFARKHGISFNAIETPEQCPEIIEGARKNEIVLIDTPSCADPQERERVAAILAKCSGLDVHLVAPAYMSANALRRAIARYSVFKPAKLIITRLDETATLGPAISEAVRAGLRLSLAGNGVSIPADLHAFSVEDLMRMACGNEPAKERNGEHSHAACA